MDPAAALLYSFLFGLLHGALPDEHTWPITFSYAIGSASGREGMRAGLFFSLAFTLQRTLLSEAAYLALAPFLLSPSVNGIVYAVVGTVMAAAGAIVLRRNRYPHLHLVGHHHDRAHTLGRIGHLLAWRRPTAEPPRPVGPGPLPPPGAPPVRWTLVHGFVAGFGFGGFSLFVNTVAAPAMPGPWAGFLPGLLFGLGTTLMLVAIGYLFGASLRWSRSLTRAEVQRIGSQTGGRTLFFGGLLFAAFAVVTLLGLGRSLPVDTGYVLIGAFMLVIAIPAFIYSLREVRAARRGPGGS